MPNQAWRGKGVESQSMKIGKYTIDTIIGLIPPEDEQFYGMADHYKTGIWIKRDDGEGMGLSFEKAEKYLDDFWEKEF